MNYKMKTVVPGTIGIDTSANLLTGYAINNYSTSLVQGLYQEAYRPGYQPFAIRYLGLDPTVVGPGDLTAAEVAFLATMGWGVMAVQERLSGWSAATGLSDGKACALNAQKCGLIVGVCIFSGAEIASTQTCIDYENAWWDGALSINPALDPSLGCYVGSNALDGEGWQDKVPQHRYWQSGANVPTPSIRGYQCRQLWPGNFNVSGIPVDWNIAQTDWKNDNMVMQIAA
jgi:hypothetical protein